MKNLRKIIREEIENSEFEWDLPKKTNPEEGVVAPSKKVIQDICEKEKFCQKQGPITFGQLRELVESAQKKNLTYSIGEGFYKALIRLLPWFIPQIAVAGFVGSSVRAFNKIIKPGIENTRNYKSWWGKTILTIMDYAEGELPTTDPISKIFFISDGLLHMMDKKFKVKFARYISEMASAKPDSEPVPEYFVENELRNWVNQKFLLNPPLPPKTINESEEDIFGWLNDSEVSYGSHNLRVGNKYRFSPNYDKYYEDNPDSNQDEVPGWMGFLDGKVMEVLDIEGNYIKFKWLDGKDIETKDKDILLFNYGKFFKV